MRSLHANLDGFSFGHFSRKTTIIQSNSYNCPLRLYNSTFSDIPY